jgi:hypothetical protein
MDEVSLHSCRLVSGSHGCKPVKHHPFIIRDNIGSLVHKKRHLKSGINYHMTRNTTFRGAGVYIYISAVTLNYMLRIAVREER